MTSHEDIVSRLPWFLAGTLGSDEEAGVRAHLEQCADCRAELERTRAAARLYEAEHPPTDELVDAAWGRLGEERAAAVAAHLESCPDCREEMSLAAASRATESDQASDPPSRPLPFPSRAHEPRPRLRQWSAVAALIVAATAVGLLGLHRFDVERRGLRSEIERTRGEFDISRRANAAAEQRSADLERRLAELSGPRAGIPVVELLPPSVLRGQPASNVAVLEPGTNPFVVLLVDLDRPRRYPALAARLIDAAGAERFVAPAAAPDATGALTVLVPTTSLPTGAATLELLAGDASSGTVVGRYRLEIRGAGAGESAPKTTNEAQ